MAEPIVPSPVKLICGMISAEVELFGNVIPMLEKAFGAVDLTSDVLDFDFTHYYDKQMGAPLFRRFVSFSDLIGGETLVDIKLQTGEFERNLAQLAAGGPTRPINLDPGYVTPAKLILASLKDFSHRIYLGRGVFAEVTLLYQKGRWETLPWTFPDYTSQRYHPFLCRVRDRLCKQLKERK